MAWRARPANGLGAMHHIVPFPLDDHSWYTLDSPADWIRAALWCGSNLITALSYFAIPVEIWHWRHALTFLSASVIGALFIAFIILCGESHLAMLLIMQTAPWWAVILIQVPMAAVSIGTAYVLRADRPQIIQVLRSLTRILQAPRDGG